jgi:hypothetical protein
VCGHDALAVEDILNRILSLIFFEDGLWRNSLGEGERRHGVRLDKLVVRRSAGDDQVGSNPGFELANAFEGAFALLRRWCSVHHRRSSKDDDGIEVGEIGIRGGDTSIDEGNSANDQDYKSGEEGKEFA